MKLSSGDEMPQFGLGTWKSKPGEVKAAVEHAITVGYRHIDCAWAYLNEKEVGEALQSVFDKGIVTRKDIFITSKLWNTFHEPEHVMSALKSSLNDLGLEYVDLYLIHWPTAMKKSDDPKIVWGETDERGNRIVLDIDPLDTWKAMEKCVDAGLVRNLGLSNCNSVQVENILLNGRIKPVNLQVEIHPYLSQVDLVKFCLKKGLAVTGYSPFGSPDRSWADSDEKSPLEDPEIIAISERLERTPAQVIIKWLLQRNIVTIPKSVTPERIESNFQLDFTLSEADMEAINGLNRNERRVCPLFLDGKPCLKSSTIKNFPFSDEIPF